MRNAFLIAWREYAENAKTRGFWLGLWLFPAILFLSIQVPIWLERRGTVRYFVLVDQSRSLAPMINSALEQDRQKVVLKALNEYAQKNSLQASQGESGCAKPDPLREFSDSTPQTVESFMRKGGVAYYLKCLQGRLRPGAPPFEEPHRDFRRVELPSSFNVEAPLPSLAEALKPYLRGQKDFLVDGKPVELRAAILIPRDIEKLIVRPAAHSAPPESRGGSIEYWSANASDTRLRDEIERAINSEIRRREFVTRGMDFAAIHQVEQTSAPFVSLDPKKQSGKEAIGVTDVIRQWAPSAFVYLLWVALFAIIQMLLHNTIEEKSNRVIEVLLSSVTPSELMMGKLFGIAGIGLTMVGAWVVALFGILSWKSGGASQIPAHVLTVLLTSNLVPMFSFYFLLGI